MIKITPPLAIPNLKSFVAPEISDTVHITLANHPFRNIRIVIELRAGDSVAEILRMIGCRADLPARIFLGDSMVSDCQREHVYPAPGELLTVRAVPAEGGGSKDVEILTIVIAAVASIAAGQFEAWALATPQFLSLSAIGQEAFTGALTAAIKFGGTQLINALIPPPRTPVPKQETTPHSYTVSGTANAAAPFSPIPKIYGERRIFPQYAASPYNELVGFDQYLRMLFLLGYGPLDISQIKIGDTAIEDYEDVEWELRSGFADDAPTRLYPGSVSEAELNIQLSKTNGGGVAPTVYDWSQVPVQTSGTNADELGVDVSFPGGLSAFTFVSSYSISATDVARPDLGMSPTSYQECLLQNSSEHPNRRGFRQAGEKG